jgi:hypothetical protein
MTPLDNRDQSPTYEIHSGDFTHARVLEMGLVTANDGQV